MLRWIIRNLSIRGKIIAITMITSLVAVVVACALFIWYDVDSFRKKMAEDIAVVAEGVAINSTPALEFESLDSAKPILGALRAYEHIETAIIFDKNGKSVVYRRPDVAEEPPPALRPDGEPYFEGDAASMLFRSVRRDGEVLGTVYIRPTSRSCARAPPPTRRPPPSWCWARSLVALAPLLAPAEAHLRAHPAAGRRGEPGEPGEGLLAARGEGHRRRAGRPHRRLQRDARADPGARRRAHGGQGGGGAGQPHQERLPGQHEPRAAHAPQRHHRLQRDAAGGGGGHAATTKPCPTSRRSTARANTSWPSSTTSSTSPRSRPGRWSCSWRPSRCAPWWTRSAPPSIPSSRRTGTSWSVDCPPDVDGMHADVTRVRQILFNLLSNASKFTEKRHRPPGGPARGGQRG